MRYVGRLDRWLKVNLNLQNNWFRFLGTALKPLFLDPFQTSCYCRAELNSLIVDTLEYI